MANSRRLSADATLPNVIAPILKIQYSFKLFNYCTPFILLIKDAKIQQPGTNLALYVGIRKTVCTLLCRWLPARQALLPCMH